MTKLGNLDLGANSLFAPSTEQWEYDYEEKQYYHKPCDCFSGNDYKCPMCGAFNPNSFTWGDIMSYIRQQGYDKDEYFSWCVSPRSHYTLWETRQVWNDNSDGHVAAWWVRGGSEGWYVHIDRTWFGTRDQQDAGNCYRDTILLGKFWDPDRAAEVCKAITEFIYK